ncbi:LOW QUALITY PROTEIN: uncharacterized protein LOC124169839 [Ischnura elegans]|uniref:LOW QUALITY PROTEIN: uncharacterized protein LOC124169839 n=1 Tax=Ischnura elegans TaxID=197161 RepID=UPI001ED88231|nr:LOW QUALITY PROTEIN: uncharacterized protein LOC124169839 [Ischnura elegans]
MMENSDKGRNPWRRNQSHLRPSQAYRQASGMPQDTGIANNYGNHLGQPAYQVNRVPETSWYGSAPHQDPNAHLDSWNWGIDTQQNAGQQFRESYPQSGPQNYPQQSQPQQQPHYQSYDRHNNPPAEVPPQQMPMQQQWHGMYQGQHGMPMNSMAYQQYDQSHLSNVDSRNQNNVGTMSGSGNGNGSGDLWNWGIDDQPQNAGEWGGNEEAWDWTIPGADTPSSEPTPVPTPGPPQQRLVQGSAEESQTTPAPFINKQPSEQPVEPTPMPQPNQPSVHRGMVSSQLETPPNNMHVHSEAPKVEEPISQLHTAHPGMEQDSGGWGGWVIEDPPQELVQPKREEVGFKESEAPNANRDRRSPENFIQQENISQGNEDITNQPQQPAPQPYSMVNSVPQTSPPENEHNPNVMPTQNAHNIPAHNEHAQTAATQSAATLNAPDINQNPEVMDPIRSEHVNSDALVQEMPLQQHTDANHNDLLLLEVSHQMNEENRAYEQWWQNPQTSHGSLDDAPQSAASSIADTRPNNAEASAVQTSVESKHKSPTKEAQAVHQPALESQWAQQLESDNLAHLTDDMASFSISSKREMGEGTPAEDEPVPPPAATGIIVQDELILGAGAEPHKKDLPEDGANLETLPDNKERLDDEEPASKFSRHPNREPSASWTQGIAQPENQEVAPPKVDVVPSSSSSFVPWQPGVGRQRALEESQETRSTAQQRSLGMAARAGAPSPRPTMGRAARPSHMVGSRDDARAPRPKYLQSRASPSPSSISQQQTTADLLSSKPIGQPRPIAARRPADDTPLPSDRNQYLETGQLRDEEEDEEDEDPCGPPSSQRPPPGLRRMVPGESSSPEAGGASASGSGMCLPVGSIAGHSEMVDDDDDDVLDEAPIPSGPRVVPGVAEGEEESTRDDGVGQVPEGGSQSSTPAISSGVVQPVAEVPNSERSETIGSEGGVVPTIMTSLSRDTADDRRGSYSRGESRRDVSAERDRATAHSKVVPSSQPPVGGESEEDEEKESGEGGREGRMGRRVARRRAGRVGRERGGADREDGEIISDDEDGDDGSGKRSVEERESQDKGRTRHRDHGKAYVGNKADRRGRRDDPDSGDDYGDERDSRDDSRREEKRRGGRDYEEHRQRHSNRSGYDQDTDLGEDPGGYYRGSHPSRRRGSSEWDHHRQRSMPPEDRGHQDDRIAGRHDYPPPDWQRDPRHREWGPEDEYARDYYSQRHPNTPGSRGNQSYYRDGHRSRTNSQLDLGGNGYDGRPSSRGAEGYYSDTNREGAWERRHRGGERGGAGLRRESAERDSGPDWHDRESRTPRHHYPPQYSHHHLRPEPPYYGGGDPRYASDSRQYSPYSPGAPYPGYEYYGHPLPPGQLPHHPYYNAPYHMHRDSYSQAYLYYEEMRRNRPHEYAEWYRKFYGRAGGPMAGNTGSSGTPGGRTPSASGGAASPVGIPRSEGGGEGVHSMEETNIGDDGRGSVHSGRSSLNLLQPGIDDDSASGRKLDADRSIGSPFRGTEPISSRASTPQRLTPAKFPTAHIKATLTNHGSLLLLKPNYLLDGPSSTVEFLSLKELLKNDPVMAELEDFPGPLIRGTTHKNSVIQFCNSKINAAMSDPGIHDRDSYILLWKLLVLLLKQNGFVVGTDISSLLLEDSAYLQNPSQGSATGSASPQLPAEELSSNSNLTTPDEGIVVGGPLPAPSLSNRSSQFSEEYLTRKFREFLLFGNTRDALEWAMKHGLWGHAMFLAYKIGGRMLASVLTRFANNLPHNDPLQTLYQLLSGRQPAAITSCSDEKWGDWRPHLAMIISNSSSHPDLHRKSIITLGDTLAARGCHHASQFCYVIAQLNLGASSAGTPASAPSDLHSLFSGPDARLVLLGSSVSLSPDSECYVPNEVVHCTEVLEYARSLADPGFCFPYFQPVKLDYAMQLVEHGMVQEGLLYCEAISTKVTSWLLSGGAQDKALDVQFLKRLEEISDRLKHHDPVMERSESGGEADPHWIQELKRCIKMMEDHSLGLMAGGHLAGGMAGMYGAQQTMDMHAGQMVYNSVGGVDGMASNQTEVAGQGVVQTGEYDAQQWNNYYYEQAKWQQQQMQQQQLQQQQLTTQPETGNSTQESLAPSNANQVSTGYEASVWNPGQVSVGNTVPNEGIVSGSGEGQDSVSQQTTTSAPTSNSLDMNTRRPSDLAQPTDKTLSSSEGGSTNYWDMATSNDQSGRSGKSRRDEEEDDGDEEDEEEEEDCDDEETDEEDEDDFAEERPPPPRAKDVPGQRRSSSSSSAPAANWRASDNSSQKSKKDALDGKGSSGASGGSGWLGGLLSKFSLRPKNQMNLPDDKNPSIVWDNEKKRWVNMDADEDEASGDLPPPPKAADLIPTMNPSSGAPNPSAPSGGMHGKPAPGNLSASTTSMPPVNNMYKMQRGRKMRQNYVDVMGNSASKGGNRATVAPPMDLFPGSAAPAPPGNFFVPAPVNDDSAPTDFLTSASTVDNDVQETSEMSRSSSMSSLSREVQGFMAPEGRGHGSSVGHRPMATNKSSAYQENQYHSQSGLHY